MKTLLKGLGKKEQEIKNVKKRKKFLRRKFSGFMKKILN